MATEVFEPEGPPVSILCCLAGGGVTRRYWDLDVPGAKKSHSFARTLAAKGHIVVLADHLGVGESSKPPPLELTVEVLAFEQHETFSRVLKGLPDLPAIGVGHSMGSMLIAIEQAHYKTFAAIALTGFANRGLPNFVPPDLVQYIDDPMALRAALPGIVAARGENPMQGRPPEDEVPIDTTSASDPPPRRPVMFHSKKLSPEVADAVRAIAAPPPPLAAMTSIVPGSIKPEMSVIDVPVLIANGDLDITGPIEDVPAGFPKSPRVDTVVLPETGHSHHAFPGRLLLYDRLDKWVRSLVTS
jgi:pimeloyl-ACP methyl ester carboxylesterase